MVMMMKMDGQFGWDPADENRHPIGLGRGIG